MISRSNAALEIGPVNPEAAALTDDLDVRIEVIQCPAASVASQRAVCVPGTVCYLSLTVFGMPCLLGVLQEAGLKEVHMLMPALATG